MKYLFKSKTVFKRDLKKGENADNQNVKIGGSLAQAKIIEQKGKDIIQQAGGYDCGWWAVYNALMFIAQGNDNFLDQFNKVPTRESGYKLRSIFENEGLSLTGTGAGQKSQAQNNNLWIGLEEALKASLIVSYPTMMDINQGMQISQDLITPKKKSNLDNKWADYIENSQLKKEVTKEYAGMLKRDVVLDQTYDDFIEFVSNGNIYVDKSLFIKYVLNNRNHLLITCPRRWGKSLNLSMLKAFLEPDEEDKAHYTEDGKYDFSRGNKNFGIFKELKIGKEEIGIVNKYQGQYPVIYLNLKGAKESSVGINNKDKGYREHNLDVKLRSAVSDAYKKHGYLWDDLVHKIKDDKLSERIRETARENLSKFKAYYQGKNIPETPLAQSIKFLSDLLKEYYGRKVFVLVDEFDKSVNDILSRGNFLERIEEAKQIAKIVSDIIAPCSKGVEPSTKQIVLTGILNSEVQEGSSEINNLSKEGVMTGQLVSYFGFNDEEVRWVLDQAFDFGNDYKELLFNRLKYWYNGQVIGNDMSVFTPSSVMKYLMNLKRLNENPRIETPKFESYWVSTETTSMLQSFATIAREKKEKGYEEILEKLVKISYHKGVHFNCPNEESLCQILNNAPHPINSESFEKLIFHYMLRSGYITKVAGSDKEKKYKLPAREVEKAFMRDVVPIWKDTLYTNKEQFQDIVKEIDFATYNTKDVDKKMTSALQYATIKYSALGEESFRIILNDAIENSKIKSAYKDVEISSGTGRADLIYYYEGNALIYELKYHNNKADGKLEEAIKQIYAQNYMDQVLKLLESEDYKALNIKEIKLIPVVMYREGNNTKWQYKTGNVRIHNIEEAQKIVERIRKAEDRDRLSEHLARGNNIEGFADGSIKSDATESKISDVELKKLLLYVKDKDEAVNRIRQLIKEKGEKVTKQDIADLEISGCGNKTQESILAALRSKSGEIKKPKAKKRKSSQSQARKKPPIKRKKFKGSEGSDGMTQREIEENLQMLVSSYKILSKEDIIISDKVLNLSNINAVVNQWIVKGENKKYSAIVKLENEEGQLHAVLLQIERINEIFKIKIIDPLSENESKFTKEVIELENKLSKYSGILCKIYANKQDSGHATCGDTCLIMMQEYLEKEVLPIQYQMPSFTISINDYNHFAMNLKLQAQTEYYISTGIIFETLQRAADNNQVILGDSLFIDSIEDYTLPLLPNDSTHNAEFDFNEIDFVYNVSLITTNFISEKLREQIDFANSTGIVFETLQDAIDNNRVTSVDLPFLYYAVGIQSCNLELSNSGLMNLLDNQAVKNDLFISLTMTSVYTKDTGINFEAQIFLHDELLINSEFSNPNSMSLIDS